jgi:hypothetical protein
MTVSLSTLRTKMIRSLNDVGSVRWIESEHIDAINDALDAILIAQPHLYEDYRDVTLVEGNEQDVPADCYLLLDVLNNIETGNVPGRAITKVSKSSLDRVRSAWTISGANETVRHWAQDVKQRSKFYVAPRQPASVNHKVRIRIARRPTTTTTGSQNVDIPDEMELAVYYFAMARMLEKDAKFSGSPQAQYYMTSFGQAVQVSNTGEDQAEATEAVNEGT